MNTYDFTGYVHDERGSRTIKIIVVGSPDIFSAKTLAKQRFGLLRITGKKILGKKTQKDVLDANTRDGYETHVIRGY